MQKIVGNNERRRLQQAAHRRKERLSRQRQGQGNNNNNNNNNKSVLISHGTKNLEHAKSLFAQVTSKLTGVEHHDKILDKSDSSSGAASPEMVESLRFKTLRQSDKFSTTHQVIDLSDGAVCFDRHEFASPGEVVLDTFLDADRRSTFAMATSQHFVIKTLVVPLMPRQQGPAQVVIIERTCRPPWHGVHIEAKRKRGQDREKREADAAHMKLCDEVDAIEFHESNGRALAFREYRLQVPVSQLFDDSPRDNEWRVDREMQTVAALEVEFTTDPSGCPDAKTKV